MKNETKPRVYDVLAKAFIQEGVRTCFALLGDANMNWAARLAAAGMPHGLRAARALRARRRHGLRAKDRRRGRGDRDLRARRDAIDHRAARGRARPPAGGGVRRRSAAEERLVQPGDRPGAAHHGDGRRLPPPAPARAHAGRGARRVPAGAPRAAAGGDRHSVRPAGPALGRAGRRCRRPRASCCRASRRFRRIPTTWPARRKLLAGAERVVVLAGLGRGRSRRRGPPAARSPPRRAGC